MMDFLDDIFGNRAEGHVVGLGGPTGYVVRGNKVYMPVMGGEAVEVGFVMDGRAYMPRMGGDPVPLGDVVF